MQARWFDHSTLGNSQSHVVKVWRLLNAAEESEKKEQKHKETTRIAIENVVKKVARAAEMNRSYSSKYLKHS